MKQYVCAPLLAFSILYPVAGTELGARERAGLLAASQSSVQLESMRAAGATDASVLDETEQGALARAQQASQQLGEMRGGDVHLSDRDLKLIAVVLLAVLVIAVIA
jgi:hypothetical protein